jgi:hypothetical protein
MPSSYPARRNKTRRPQAHVTPQEAQEALDYWLGRLKRLPHHRRKDRREARAMIARWERRYRDAVVSHRARTILGRIALEIGLGFLLEPPRAPGGPLARRRRQRALRALEEQQRKELADFIRGKR